MSTSPAPAGLPSPSGPACAASPAAHGGAAGAARRTWPAVAAIAIGAFGLEMAVSARYGYHRDELYFLAAGRHPAFGYVDQPPLAPLAARAASAVFGGWLPGLRLLPALLLGVMVILTAVMSRLLGAGRAGQLIAAAATATCAEYLGGDHLLSTTSLDFAFWALTLTLTLRMLSTSDPRWWLAIGACVGVGAEAKWDVGLLAATLAAGIAASSQRRLLRTWQLPAAALLAASLAAPDLIWQAAHGWPNFAVFAHLQTQAGHNRLVYWPAQLLYTGWALAPLWLAGLRWCLTSPQARPFRPAAIAALACLAAFFVAGGKPYYAGGVYTFLFAAGSIPLERRLAHRGAAPGASRRRYVRFAAGLALSAAVAAPIALPVLPAQALAVVPLQKINYDLGETIGWPRLVAEVAHLYRGLPPGQRAATAVLTGNYGEAGAIDEFGPALGLPQAYSGANNFWYWGPPPGRDTAAVAVNIDPSLLRRMFTRVWRVGTFHNGLGVADDEQGVAIYRASGRRLAWPVAWRMLRDFA